MEDDIKLMRVSLDKPKQWSKISKHFPGRTQHQIKNRFICVLSKELEENRNKVRELIKANNLENVIKQALNQLEYKQKNK